MGISILEIEAKGDWKSMVITQSRTLVGFSDRRFVTRWAIAAEIVRLAMQVPLDEALTRVVIDLSGRPYLVYKAEFQSARVGICRRSLSKSS
jgi:imidazoleglycerol phosphate dehydratase HisB